MAFTDKLSIVGQALEAYIRDGMEELGLVDVWYSEDTGSVPQTPSVVIEPSSKNRLRSDTGHTTLNTFNVEITIFHARLEATGVTRKECDDLAEALEDYLHQNYRLGGLVLDSFVQTTESGIANRQRAMLRATRLLWVARSKTRLI